MPNDTLAANAAPMPLDRRLFLASGSAVAVFGALRSAKASSEDAGIFAALARLDELHRAQTAAYERLSALEVQYPKREAFAALTAQSGDCVIFKTPKAEGEVLDIHEVNAAHGVMRAFQRLGIGETGAWLGPAYARAAEVCRAEDDWRSLRNEVRERMGIDQAQDAFDDAVSATTEAAEALLDLRPRTIAGLRAIIVALNKVGHFSCLTDAADLAALLLESPALAKEL